MSVYGVNWKPEKMQNQSYADNRPYVDKSKVAIESEAGCGTHTSRYVGYMGGDSDG